MYYIKKTLEVAAAHKLQLDYESPCGNLHGHNWKITVYCKAPNLDPNGMVIDFKRIKEKVHDKFDHGIINDVLLINPTAENIAKWIVDNVPYCYKADVEESSNNTATYEI